MSSDINNKVPSLVNSFIDWSAVTLPKKYFHCKIDFVLCTSCVLIFLIKLIRNNMVWPGLTDTVVPTVYHTLLLTTDPPPPIHHFFFSCSLIVVSHPQLFSPLKRRHLDLNLNTFITQFSADQLLHLFKFHFKHKHHFSTTWWRTQTQTVHVHTRAQRPLQEWWDFSYNKHHKRQRFSLENK